jgi:hypothetical protein
MLRSHLRPDEVLNGTWRSQIPAGLLFGCLVASSYPLTVMQTELIVKGKSFWPVTVIGQALQLNLTQVPLVLDMQDLYLMI